MFLTGAGRRPNAFIMYAFKGLLSGRQKLKLMLVMIVMAGLLFLANVFEKAQMTSMDESFLSIYRDRLVPAVSIFEIQDRLYRKRELLREMLQSGAKEQVQKGIDSCNTEIAALLTDYKKTYFSGKETDRLREFESNLGQYDLVETNTLRLVDSGNLPEAVRNYQENAGTSFRTAILKLSELTHIQSDIGKGMLSDSKKTMANFLVLSNLETVLIVIFSVIAHVLIYTRQVMVRRRMEPFNMN